MPVMGCTGKPKRIVISNLTYSRVKSLVPHQGQKMTQIRTPSQHHPDPLTGMDLHVGGEVGGGAEPLVAHWTDVVPLVGVTPQVDRQRVLPTEGLTAESTLVRPGKRHNGEGVVSMLESDKYRNSRHSIPKQR